VREELNQRVTAFLATGGAINRLPPAQPKTRAKKLKLTPTPNAVEYQQFAREIGVEVVK
jgi:hypothetical protein